VLNCRLGGDKGCTVRKGRNEALSPDKFWAVGMVLIWIVLSELVGLAPIRAWLSVSVSISTGLSGLSGLSGIVRKVRDWSGMSV
jgi:hypothetical protein